MAFLCPARRCRGRKGYGRRQEAPLPGRITGSDSIDTLVRVGLEKERGLRVRMVVIHDFSPCVDDELKVCRGQQVHVLYQENDWLYVIASDGKEGFVPYTYCLPLERSVDDFALPKPAGKPSKTHLRDIKHSGLTKANSKSMPDIASTCEAGDNGVISAISSRNEKPSKEKKKNRSNCQGRTTGIDNRGYIDYSLTQENVTTESPDLLTNTKGTMDAHLLGNSSIVKPKPFRPATGKQKERSDSFKQATQNHGVSLKGRSTSTSISNATVSGEPKIKGREAPSCPYSYSSYSGFDTINTTEHLINTSTDNLIPAAVKQFCKKPQGIFIVLFSFNGLEENDVSVKRGEFVTLLNRDDPEWFWVLRMDGHEGFVPTSFLCPAEAQLPGAETQSARGSVKAKMGNIGPSPITNAAKTLTKLTCLYDYKAEKPDHISVRRGESLYADMESQTNNAWIFVYASDAGKCGFIPRSHAKPLNVGLGHIDLETHVLDPYISP